MTGGIRPDTVFLPFHFPGAQRANLLTLGITDPVSGMPEFKRTTVRVRALERTPGSWPASSVPSIRTDAHA